MRIVELKDGSIISDSNPVSDREEIGKEYKLKRTKMSFKEALQLSFNNIMTKKGRTLLTAFASSIGIIGIALILSLSTGVNNYINKVQEDTLTSYPLSLEKTNVDTSTLMTSFMGSGNNSEHELDAVYSNDIMTNMISTMYGGVTTNNLKEFKKYIESNSEFSSYTNDIKYTYNLDLQIYKDYLKVNPSNLMAKMFGRDDTGNSMFSNNVVIFNELTSNRNLLNSQYDIVKGRLPQNYDELVLIIDENNEINDYVLYSIGIKDQKEIQETMQNMAQGKEIQKFEQTKYNYDDILNINYKLIFNSDLYEKDGNVWIDKSTDLNYIKKLVDNGINLKIVGIIKPKEGSNLSLTNGVGYTKELSSFVIEKNNQSTIVSEQLKNKDINVFTGVTFSGLETYETNLMKMGFVDMEDPYTINIYSKDFDSKNKIKDLIKEYNDEKEKNNLNDQKIEYTDYVDILMNSVTTIVNVIGYVLIAFVSISLIVSSIMIGIITYISVLERTKEIGILRAVGASKKDISRVFNAETFIVGLSSGIIGILITNLLNILINIAIKSLTGIVVKATLPVSGAITLVLISTILTIIAGLIPSKIASKKDPVIALRTE